MNITKLEALTKTKFKVFLDGEFAFVLYKGELSRYGIKEDGKLNEETYHVIVDELLTKRAKLRAMHLLEAMDRTESGLRDKLKDNGYPEIAIERAVDYVKSFGYINDERYAFNFINNRKDSKSRREIYALLCRKGIDKETMDNAFMEVYEQSDDKEAIRRLINKRHVDVNNCSREELTKLYGYLGRKGFGYEDIRQVIQEAQQYT